MSLHIDLGSRISARLLEAARMQGIEPAKLVENLLAESLSPASHNEERTLTLDAENIAAIAWLDQRLAEEATDDPEEIRFAEEELAELKYNMNANRAATGERLVFP